MIFSLSNLQWVILGNGIFWNPQEILSLPCDDHQKDDSIFLCDEKKSTETVQAIPFSTYDGFAIKNILANILKISSAVIIQSTDFQEIIQRRCRDLKIPFCFTGIQNPPQFITQFCNDHQCALSDTIIFDNNLTIPDFNGEHPKFLGNNTKMPQHYIRSFVNSLADHNDNVLSYYNETRAHKIDCPQNIRSKTKKIRALICDIDGTCTDGFKIYGEDGSEWKRFARSDIKAMKNWNRSENLNFFITGESSSIPQKFAQHCFIPPDHVFMNAGNGKIKILYEICQKYSLTLGEIAYIGDDMNDLGIMEFLIEENGIAACPANAMPLIKNIPQIIALQTVGGNGSIAELIDIIARNFT